MPELPEVETTLRGISPFVVQQKINSVSIRQHKLRWPIPSDLPQILQHKVLKSLERRAKYLLFRFEHGTLILHLGMSGHLRVFAESDLPPPKKHDHVDIGFANHYYLRLSDPRRFGAVLWMPSGTKIHPLLAHLGPEPLSSEFEASHLWQKSRKRKIPIKSFLMDSKIVVGIGNIYAQEALFIAKIKPRTAAGKLSLQDYERLTKAIKLVLNNAVQKGGTTLRDFNNPSGSPGYFAIELQVYGRTGEPCVKCNRKLKSVRIANRSTVYCGHCQK